MILDSVEIGGLYLIRMSYEPYKRVWHKINELIIITEYDPQISDSIRFKYAGSLYGNEEDVGSLKHLDLSPFTVVEDMNLL